MIKWNNFLTQSLEEEILLVRRELNFQELPKDRTIFERNVRIMDMLIINTVLFKIERRFKQMVKEGDSAMEKGRTEESIAIVTKLRDEATFLKESAKQHLYLASLYRKLL